MDLLAFVTFDSVVMSVITCLAFREVMLACLPDHIAGPGGWLIDTSSE